MLCWQKKMFIIFTSIWGIFVFSIISTAAGCSRDSNNFTIFDAAEDSSIQDSGKDSTIIIDVGRSDSVDVYAPIESGTTEPDDVRVASDTNSFHADVSESGEESCADSDEDGFSDINCGGDDCDDQNSEVHPGNIEVCNNDRDDDCDITTLDTGDMDGDGFSCLEDCDDTNRHINPSRPEVCGNGLDDDCDELTLDLLDVDNDGSTCDQDCDDNDPFIHPLADEICNNQKDDDCNSDTKDQDDVDKDGLSCDVDCNDNDPSFPGQNYYCGSDFLYFEGFETGDGGWTVGGDQPGWELGPPDSEGIVEAASGHNAWVTLLEGDYPPDSLMTLTSPRFDMSGLEGDPVLFFSRKYTIESGDQLWLEISVDGGQSWSHLSDTPISQNFYNATQSFIGISEVWQQAKTKLTNTAGFDDVRIRFVFLSDDLLQDDGFALDDVWILDKSLDVRAVALNVPEIGCGDRSNESITLSILNNSSQQLVDFSLAYRIDDTDIVLESITDEVNPGEEFSYTFQQSADLSSIGSHRVSAWIELEADKDSDFSDNRVQIFTFTFPQIATDDYSESFESDDGGWTTLGQNSSWIRANPKSDVIDGAADGQYAWVSNPWGKSNRNEMSYLVSPCFDFSDLDSSDSNPILIFSHIYDIDVAGWLEISTDGGSSFSRLGTSTSGFNWYNEVDTDSWYGLSDPNFTWITAYHSLDGSAGQAQVQLRFALQSTGTTSGMGVDKIHIVRSFVEPRIAEFAIPEYICESDGSVPIGLSIVNDGNQNLTDFDLVYQLDDQTQVVETVEEIVPPEASYPHEFSTEMVVPSPGQHSLRFEIRIEGDFDQDNSRVEVPIEIIPAVSAYQYAQNFDLSDGGWSTYGYLSSWHWGTPFGAYAQFINSASGGTGKAWVTDLFGNYHNEEESYLLSPCLDFTDYINQPVISFDHIYQTEECCDAGWLEMSTDGGGSWIKVGSSTTGGTNWYNDSSNDCWNGSSGSPGQWQTASHPLDEVAGRSNVLIRFVMHSNSDTTEEGFGVDNISFIEP